MYFLLATIVVILGLLGMRIYSHATPAERQQLARRGAGGLSLALALWLAGTGKVLLAAPLAVFGVLMLVGAKSPLAGPFAGAGNDRVAHVRTAFLAMTLDRATGVMRGQVLAGSLSGKELDNLSEASLAQLYRECRAGETQSRQLLELYLDRRWPRWRSEMAAGGGGATGAGAGAAGSSAGASSGSGAPTGRKTPMTRQEAYEVLGLGAKASREEIKAAHRNLMKRLHPDQGGSNYLAAKINEAKEVLLGRGP